MGDIVEVRKLFGTFVRMGWLILLLTVCMGLLGYLFSKSQTPIYEATTTLIVGPSMQTRDLNRSQIQTSQEVGLTYANVARRHPVLNGTVEALDLDLDWRSLRNSVDVALVSNTQLLEISVRAPSPFAAEVIADEIARQLILLSPTDMSNREDEQTREFVQLRLHSLQTKIEEGERRLIQLQAQDMSDTSAVSILQTQDEISALEGLITAWEANYSTLLSTLTRPNDSANYLEVIEPALASNSPVRPRILLNTMVSLIVGLIISLGLALLLDALDETIHTTEEISELLQIPLLAKISRFPSGSASLISGQSAYARPVEDFRLLRSKLLLLEKENVDGKTFALASPGSNQGASPMVANLGIVMAQSGLATIIVDADIRNPKQHLLFNVENERGLINLLSYPELRVDGLLKKCPQTPNLYILNAGILWQEQVSAGGILSLTPTELLGFETMTRILKQLRQKADVVLIDCPPVVPFADSTVLSSVVDGAILVCCLNNTKRRDAYQSLLNMQQTHANILGYVASQPTRFGLRLINPIELYRSWKTVKSSPASIPQLPLPKHR